MTHEVNIDGNVSVSVGDTISSGAIDGIAQALHMGFNALCECGLGVTSMHIVDDVYTAVVIGVAEVIDKGNPAFDKKKFLIAVWNSKWEGREHEQRMQIEDKLRESDTRFGGDE